MSTAARPQRRMHWPVVCASDGSPARASAQYSSRTSSWQERASRCAGVRHEESNHVRSTILRVSRLNLIEIRNRNSSLCARKPNRFYTKTLHTWTPYNDYQIPPRLRQAQVEALSARVVLALSSPVRLPTRFTGLTVHESRSACTRYTHAPHERKLCSFRLLQYRDLRRAWAHASAPECSSAIGPVRSACNRRERRRRGNDHSMPSKRAGACTC